jgi:simple sugar transport system ATP-binding protein
LFQLQNIYKTFPSNGARALEGADFEVAKGEIHALFGENGAGKSTLMQILAGFQQADSGRIIINGQTRRFFSPADALSRGISMVRQRPAICPSLPVWEACVLGAEARRGPFLRRKASRDMVNRLSLEWGFDLPVEAPAETLDAAGRQKAAVLAALLRNVSLLIFDEATAILNQAESEKFFALVGRLAASGLTTVIISHKLDETLAVAGRATVLRKGRTAAVLDRAGFSAEKIIPLMFGGEYESASTGISAVKTCTIPQISTGRRGAATLQALLRAENLSVEQAGYPAIHSVNINLYGGTVYGLAGVSESGTETLMLTLAGFLRPSAGRVLIGEEALKNGTRAFRGNGGAYLGMDGGNFIAAWDKELSIRDNLVIHAHRRFSRNPNPSHPLARLDLLDGARLRCWTLSMMRGADIAGPSGAKAGTLSGGMLQRLFVARELAENVSVIIMSEPGWGLDSRRRSALFDLLRDAADEGKAVLLFLSDLNDLVEVSDEIFVMCRGGITLNLGKDKLSSVAPHTPSSINGHIKRQINAAMSGVAGQ